MQTNQTETDGPRSLDPVVSLRQHVKENTRLFGCREVSLGTVKMPPGYALMLNKDESHYYWLRHDGVESVIHWDRWAAYRGACINAVKRANEKGER